MDIPSGYAKDDALALDANSLALVAAIAQAGSLTAAARALGCSQPALTKQLQRIERQLGVNLFVRDMRGVRPTDYGHALLPRARTVQAQVRQSVEAVEQLRGRREGHVSVALSHLATLLLLPPVMAQFRIEWPQVQVRIVPPAFPDRFDGLRAGAPDFAVVPRPAEPLGSEYLSTPLLTSTVVAIARPGHLLAGASSLRELTGAQWVLPSVQSTSAHALNRVFERARLPAPRIAVACETLTGVEVLVAQSDLLGLVPLEVQMRRAGASGLVALPLEARIEGPSLALIRWRDSQPTPAAARLAELFVMCAQPHQRRTTRGGSISIPTQPSALGARKAGRG